MVTTAANAFLNAEERTGATNARDLGDEIITLRHGVCALRSVYDELDAEAALAVAYELLDVAAAALEDVASAKRRATHCDLSNADRVK
jgi:hypothetical protein